MKKHITTSELWNMVCNDEVAGGDKFLLDDENCDEKPVIVYSAYEGEFIWEDTNNEVSFNRYDKWVKLPSKPKMTKHQAEQSFGIEIID